MYLSLSVPFVLLPLLRILHVLLIQLKVLMQSHLTHNRGDVVAGNFFSVHLCLFNAYQWNYVWCLEERNTFNTEQIVGFQDFEINADENILDWVTALALKSGVCLLQWCKHCSF